VCRKFFINFAWIFQAVYNSIVTKLINAQTASKFVICGNVFKEVFARASLS
jgi:hypothetical protein